MTRSCTYQDCPGKHYAKGFCKIHYERVGRHGDPEPRRDYRARDLPIADRMAHWTDTSGDCWLWRGALDRWGYGKVTVDGQSRYAHRIAYALGVGQIPDGMTVDHLCRVRNCVRPDHMEPVTNAENVRRARGLI